MGEVVIDLEFIVYGTPGPQGSKSYKGTTASGIPMFSESSAKVKPWRQDVKFAALEAVKDQNPPHVAADCALAVHIHFTLPRPKSARKSPLLMPKKQPDVDKLVRSTFDAISEAGIWVDDSRVCELHTTKVYVGHVSSLRAPGAVIRIWGITE